MRERGIRFIWTSYSWELPPSGEGSRHPSPGGTENSLPSQQNQVNTTTCQAKPENYKDKERILKAARDKRVLLNLQGKTHKGSSRPVPWNLAGQKGGVGNGQCAEWEHMQRRLLSPARLSFRIERETKAFPDRQNLMEFMTTKPALQEILRGHSVSGKQQRLQRTRGLT